jgi:glutamate N-acetyltransferase/amino-acid N-acetyltransferase
VRVDIDLRSGMSTATAWGCDLSKRYVDINAEYST